MIKKFFLVVCLLTPTLANAVVVERLNEVSIPVTNQDSVTRIASLKAGLAAVITKLSGSRTVLQHPSIIKILRTPEPFVQRFGYSPSENDPTKHELDIVFDETLIRDVLRRNQLPNWSSYRPSILVWLAIEVNQDRYILSKESNARVVEMLNKTAEDRGLPIVLPLLDLADSKVSVGHVWYDDRESILKASRRYGVEATAVGRLYQDTANKWIISWSLYNNNEAYRWQRESYTVEGVLGDSIDGIAARIAQLYTEPSTTELTSAWQSITVYGLKNFASYVNTQRFLESIECVNRVSPQGISDDTATFLVYCDADPTTLRQAMRLGNVLTEIPRTLPLPNVSSENGTNAAQPFKFRYTR